jgi:hypothetical protein
VALIDERETVRRTFDVKIQRLRKYFDVAIAGDDNVTENALDVMAQTTDSLKNLVNAMYPSRYVKLNLQELYHLRQATCVSGSDEKLSDMLAKIDIAIERMRPSDKGLFTSKFQHRIEFLQEMFQEGNEGNEHALDRMIEAVCEIDTLLEDMHPGGYVRFTHAEIAFLKCAMSDPAVYCPLGNDLTERVTAKLDGK